VFAQSRNPTGNTALHAALAGRHTMVAGLLIGAGADVNASHAKSWRPPHPATAKDDPSAIKNPIAQGAPTTARQCEGKTALSMAQEKGHREAAALLRRHGA